MSMQELMMAGFFLMGCSCGGLGMWLYFDWQGLIRTKDEYYRAHPNQTRKDYPTDDERKDPQKSE